MITVIIFTILFSALTYGMLVLGVSNRRLRNRLVESEATVKAYDDAAAKYNARAYRAEHELKEAKDKLAKFDRKRRADGRFISERTQPAGL